jgi:hypothetical protein
LIPKIANYIVILTGFAIGLYSVDSDAKEFSYEVGKLDTAIKQMFEGIEQQVSQNGKPLKIFITDITSLYNQENNLDKYIADQFVNNLSSSLKFHVIDRIKLDKLLGDMRINLNNLNDPRIRDEFANQSEADALFFGSSDASSKDTIRINAWILGLHPGRIVAEISMEVGKDNSLRKLLGEKIPGKLLVKAHYSHAEVYLDDERMGILERDSLLVSVAPGYHTVRINKSGFESYNKSFYMLENGFEKIEIKFKKDIFAPLNCVLASTIVPGLGEFFYGGTKTPQGVESPADGLLICSAMTFYIVGFFYIFDEFVSKPNFYSPAHQKKYNRWKNAEQYITVGAYTLNILSSINVGREYKKRNQKAIEVSLERGNSSVVYSHEPIVHKGIQANINFYF